MDHSAKLARALEANKVTFDAGQLQLLLQYEKLLGDWNERINLVSRASIERMDVQHIADAAAAVRWLPDGSPVVDLGTGGGLPGIVIAILRPELDVTLADTKNKKINFLQNCVRDLNLPKVRVHDAAGAAPEREYKILVCRAFATLEKIVREGRRYLAPHGTICALKGRRETVDEELAALPGRTRAEIIEYRLVDPDGEDSERNLVIIRT